MASNYNGDEANVVIFISATVASWNSTSPVRLTTTAAHGFSQGDWIYTASIGMPSITAQYFKINVISSTIIELIGSTNDSTPTASGAGILDLSLSPGFSIPDAGDPITAASVYVAMKALADRTQYLSGAKGSNYTPSSPALTTTLGVPAIKTLVGPLHALMDNTIHNANNIATNTTNIATNASDITTLQDFVGTPPRALRNFATASATGAGVTLSHGGTTSANVVIIGGISGVQVGDIVELDISSTIALMPFSSTPLAVNIQLQANQAGGGYANVTNATTGASIQTAGSGTAQNIFPFNLKGIYTATAAGTHALQLVVSSAVGSASDAVKWDTFPYQAIVKVWRAT